MTLPAPTYDLVLLLDTQAEESTRAKILADARASIEARGEIVRDDDWGERPLSYPIDHRKSAEYHLIQFHVSDKDLLSGLDRTLRITDGVMRFRLIKLRPGTPAPPDMRSSAAPPRAGPRARPRPRRPRARAGPPSPRPHRRPPRLRQRHPRLPTRPHPRPRPSRHRRAPSSRLPRRRPARLRPPRLRPPRPSPARTPTAAPLQPATPPSPRVFSGRCGRCRTARGS